MEAKKTILLVEDESIIALNEALVLKQAGYEVIIANSGEKAIQVFQNKGPFDLVLMDIDLGYGMDGTETARRILEKHPVPIVFLTSHTEQELVSKVRGITRYGYVIKDSGNFVLQTSIEMALELFNAHKEIEEKEKALRREKYLSDEMIESIPCAFYVIDKNGKRFRWNRFSAELAGGDVNDPGAASILHRVLPEDKDLAAQKVREAFTTGYTEGLVRYFNAKNEIVYMYMQAKKSVIDNEPFVIGAGVDITKRIEAEKALEKSRMLLDRAQRLERMGSWEIDLTKHTIDGSIMAHEIYGVPEGKMNLEFVQKVPLAEYRPLLDQALQDLQTGKGKYDVTFKIKRLNDGEIRDIHSIAEMDPVNHTVIGSFQDITEKLQAESQIKRLLEEKDLLLKEVHHRVKNNLSVMRSLLNMQMHAVTATEAVCALQDAVSRIQSMGTLYEKLYQSRNYSEVSIRDYLSQLSDEIMKLFPVDKTVRVEKQIENFMIPAKIISPLGIIFNELFTNAIKHAFIDRPEGVIKISVTRDNSKVVLIFEDNGQGMEKAEKDETEGFGLNLIRILVQQIGGNSTIKFDKGTHFILEFDNTEIPL